MKENRIVQQVTAVFSTLMVFFYIGGGYYVIHYADRFNLDKSVLILLGSTFIFYGLYRAYRAYVKIVNAFFKEDTNNE